MTSEPFDRVEHRASPSMERGRVGLRTLILIRWIAVAGQAATLLTVRFGLGLPLPLDISLAIVGASALINVANSFHRPSAARLDDRDATLYLAFDAIQLGALLFLTGGLQNPFSLLMLAPVTVGATILTRRSVVALSVLTVAVITVLAGWHLPLPWPAGQPEFPDLYVVGLWAALALSTVFIAAYTWSVTEEGRRMSDAFAATQLSLAREQRISAVGALAAAAAHELGSPLGTIVVIAKELARDLPPDSPFAEDAALLLSESGRCRTILAGLALRPEADGGTPYTRLPITVLVEAAGAPHQQAAITVEYRAHSPSGSDTQPPPVARSPEIMHGLGNIIQNAIQFARRRVQVTTGWDERLVTVEVADDGPGFSAHVLSRLGEPYLSGRDEEAEHMGLGIFIAETLLERTGATLDFVNGRSGGATVRIEWPRAALERAANPADTRLA
ncbi:MAG TPA: ActS/PrrB/RegB family redox-sensitive histidine kinase [Stellaceae bacterium]|nr:ActS/PrrB/RegB family redox-sensitive histidine kinase [Stellaceae bacterium]